MFAQLLLLSLLLLVGFEECAAGDRLSRNARLAQQQQGVRNQLSSSLVASQWKFRVPESVLQRTFLQQVGRAACSAHSCCNACSCQLTDHAALLAMLTSTMQGSTGRLKQVCLPPGAWIADLRRMAISHSTCLSQRTTCVCAVCRCCCAC